MCKIFKIYDTFGLFVINKQNVNTRVFEGIELVLLLYLYLLNHSAATSFSYFKVTVYEIVLLDWDYEEA